MRRGCLETYIGKLERAPLRYLSFAGAPRAWTPRSARLGVEKNS